MSTSIAPQGSALTRDLALPSSVPENKVTTPRLVYGTAWKKERTADLVHEALRAGFRGVDTAAQPRHYREDLVGEGLRRAVAEGLVAREQVFLQTKFSPVAAHDRDNMPYDPRAPLQEQVRVSVESSLRNLAVATEGEESYIDSIVLHSPLPSMEETVVVWKALSKWVQSPQRRVRALGISNAPLDVVAYLLEAPDVRVKPAVVQNRFHEPTGWEVDLRALCRRHGVVFQSFWTLSGNPRLRHREPSVQHLARAAGVEAEVALYALVLGLEGTTILDGTTSWEHMRADLDGIEKVGRWAETEGKETWDKALADFKTAIGEKA
jgi:diketogulonate reductase-like aldo/keto reductase